MAEINGRPPGGMLIGGVVTSGTSGSILYVDSSGTLAQDNTNLFYTPATKLVTIGSSAASGSAILQLKSGALAGSATTDNWVNITGTFPTTLTAATYGVNLALTGAGSSSQALVGIQIVLLAGYTGSSVNAAGVFGNSTAGTGATLIGSAIANIGAYCYSNATTTGTNAGAFCDATGGNVNVGFAGRAVTAKNSATNVGVMGCGLNTGSSPVQVGGYFGLVGATPTLTSAGLIASNGTQTSLIADFWDNTTSVVQFLDGGNVNFISGEIQSAGNRVNYNLSVYAVGTAYSFTNTSAALTFGTTSPSLTIDKAGTYLLSARVNLEYNAATFAANRTVTLKLRRTNNTAADVTSSSTAIITGIVTTTTTTFVVVQLPPVVYTTALTNDAIAIFGDVNTVPSAGSLDATEASIVAVRMY